MKERDSVNVLVSIGFLSADPWFEINPHEAGYSLTGVFVDTCNFGSQFHEGSKKKHQDEFDMLYLQGKTLCHRGVQYLGNTLFVISTCIA